MKTAIASLPFGQILDILFAVVGALTIAQGAAWLALKVGEYSESTMRRLDLARVFFGHASGLCFTVVSIAMALFVFSLSHVNGTSIAAAVDAALVSAGTVAAPAPAAPVAPEPEPEQPSDGFLDLIDRPGVRLIYYPATDNCYLLASLNAEYLEVEPLICAAERRRLKAAKR